MTKHLLLTLFVMNLICVIPSFGQEHTVKKDSSHTDEGHHDVHKKHVISGSINHTVIFQAIKDGENNTNITLPSFGINYTYVLSPKWGIGLHSDIILEDFVVKGNNSLNEGSSTEGNNTAVIERGTPISSVVLAIYKPVPYLGLMAGVGREFSSHEDFTVIRFGIEAPFHLPNHWEMFGVLTYDINIDAYQSLTYGMGIAKAF